MSNSAVLPIPAEEDIREVTRRIVAIADPERIILFGSCARGEAGKDSDIDLVVVVSDAAYLNKGRTSMMLPMWESLYDIPVPIDLIVLPYSEFEEKKQGRYNVIAQACNEGKVIYERSA